MNSVNNLSWDIKRRLCNHEKYYSFARKMSDWRVVLHNLKPWKEALLETGNRDYAVDSITRKTTPTGTMKLKKSSLRVLRQTTAINNKANEPFSNGSREVGKK